MNQEVLKPQKILRPKQVCELLGIPKSTLYPWIRDGEFPKPFNMGKRAVGWTEETINNWVLAKQAKGSK